MYPGDLTNFFTTEAPEESSRFENNDTKLSPKLSSQEKNQSAGSSRSKRSLYVKNEKRKSDTLIQKQGKLLKSQYKFRNPEMSESRLHASYHKPSVSVMNDIPAEMYFDGAGFLRYEDDSEESNGSPQTPQSYNRPRSRSHHDNNNKALKQFREAFNISREREPTAAKFDDDVRYPDSTIYSKTPQEGTFDHGAQESDNANPLGIDFISAYQREMLANMHNYAQVAQTPNAYQADPFSFTYPNVYNAQSDFNHMNSPLIQQEPLLQNHRLQPSANVAGIGSPAVYATSPSQPLDANSGYLANFNHQQYPKVQRRKRSVLGNSEEVLLSASEPSQNHYPYSRLADQQDSSSGFIPITGSYNGGAIQLNFPIFGGNPSYSSRPPIQTYHTYSVPMQHEGRPYRDTMERYYHPSEARRYSYGILGSGNFEVIRGGVFPGDRHGGGYGGGFQGERVPYGGGGGGYGNYGTTEIILNGPIQGFQGFDNFPAHLINALSKHSELSIHPDRREAKDVAS